MAGSAELMQSKMHYLDGKQIKNNYRSSETDTIDGISGLSPHWQGVGEWLHSKKTSNQVKKYTGFTIFWEAFVMPK